MSRGKLHTGHHSLENDQRIKKQDARSTDGLDIHLKWQLHMQNNKNSSAFLAAFFPLRQSTKKCWLSQSKQSSTKICQQRLGKALADATTRKHLVEHGRTGAPAVWRGQI